jgi:hypothetical protein
MHFSIRFLKLDHLHPPYLKLHLLDYYMRRNQISSTSGWMALRHRSKGGNCRRLKASKPVNKLIQPRRAMCLLRSAGNYLQEKACCNLPVICWVAENSLEVVPHGVEAADQSTSNRNLDMPGLGWCMTVWTVLYNKWSIKFCLIQWVVNVWYLGKTFGRVWMWMKKLVTRKREPFRIHHLLSQIRLGRTSTILFFNHTIIFYLSAPAGAAAYRPVMPRVRVLGQNSVHTCQL